MTRRWQYGRERLGMQRDPGIARFQAHGRVSGSAIHDGTR